MIKSTNKKVLLTYATTNNHYYTYQQSCVNSFFALAEFDTIYPCNENNILLDFKTKNKHIFNSNHGGRGALRANFWLWKPYLILRCLKKMDEGDILMYVDATITQRTSLVSIFDILKSQDILPFKINDGKGDERDATKRDAFILMNCDTSKYWTGELSGQLNASHMCFKKTKTTMNFVEEWLTFCEDERIITEMENTQGKPNYKEFVCHRHDQSVFSLLIKKYNITAYTDLTQHGNRYRLPHEVWGQPLIHGR